MNLKWEDPTMIKIIDTYTISDKEKEFLKNHHMENGNSFADIFPLKSEKLKEVEKSDDFKKYDSEVEQYSYNGFINRTGSTVVDAENVKHENCDVISGVVVDNNPELRKNCIVGSYLAVKCLKELMDHADEYDPNKPDRSFIKTTCSIFDDFKYTKGTVPFVFFFTRPFPSHRGIAARSLSRRSSRR